MTEKLDVTDHLDYVSTLFKVYNHHLIVCLSAPMQVSGLSSMSGGSEILDIGNQVSTSAGVGTGGRTSACTPDGTSVTELQNLDDRRTPDGTSVTDNAVKALLDLLVIGLPRAIGSADGLACLIRWKLQFL